MSRIVLLLVTLACSLEAQAPGPRPRVPLPDWHSFLKAPAAAPPQVCAIPLLNVLRTAPAAAIPLVRPRADVQFPMQQVQVPAPACDNIHSSSAAPVDEQNPARPH